MALGTELSDKRIRWHAEVSYRTDKPNNFLLVEHDLSELADLHDLIERGPHWDTVEEITITRVNHSTGKDLTIEEAKKR